MRLVSVLVLGHDHGPTDHINPVLYQSAERVLAGSAQGDLLGNHSLALQPFPSHLVI